LTSRAHYRSRLGRPADTHCTEYCPQGNLSYRDAAEQVFPGTLSVIDPTVYVYQKTLHVNNETLSGMPTLVDDEDGKNNDLLFAVTNGNLVYNAEVRRN
jgi:hypothetical protein